MTKANRDPLVSEGFELGGSGKLGDKESNRVGSAVNATHTKGVLPRGHGV